MLEIIEYGYSIPFVEYPTSCFLKNNASSRAEADFVRNKIEDLLVKGYIEELDYRPYCCNPLTVVKGRKLRLVIDLRHVNAFVQYCPVKYEDWELLEQVVEADDYFISFDLTAGYHHVSILPAHRRFLGFAYDWGGKVRHFNFNVLPFGLCTACYVFTKLNRPLVKLWRSMGIRSFVYIDDGIGVFKSTTDANLFAPIMRSHLEQSGFLINEEKSNWIPSKSLSWLGFTLNSSTMKIFVEHEKLLKVLKLCESLLAKKSVTPRQVAAITGKIISMQRALGPVARLMTRHMTFWVQDNLQMQWGNANECHHKHAQYNEHKLVVEPDSSFGNNAKKARMFPPCVGEHHAGDTKRCNTDEVIFPPSADKPTAMFGHRASVSNRCNTNVVIFPPSADEPTAMFGHRASVGKWCSTDEVIFPPSADEPTVMFGHRASVSNRCNTNVVIFPPSADEPTAMCGHRASVGKWCSTDEVIFPPSADEPTAMSGHRASVGKWCNTDEVIFPPSADKPTAMFGHRASVSNRCNTNVVIFPPSADEPTAMFGHRASVGKWCSTDEVICPPSADEPTAMFGHRASVSNRCNTNVVIFPPSADEPTAMFGHRASVGKRCNTDEVIFPPSADKPTAMFASVGEWCNTDEVMFPPSADEQTAMFRHRVSIGKWCNTDEVMFPSSAVEPTAMGTAMPAVELGYISSNNIRDDWDRKAALSINAEQEIRYWLTNLVIFKRPQATAI